MAATTGPDHCINTLKSHLRSDLERRIFSQDACMLAVTGALVRAIERKGMKRAQVAEKIGRSQGFVSQVLNGSRNMTLKTLADILWACDLQVRDLVVSPIGESRISRERMDAWLDGESPSQSPRVTATLHASASRDLPPAIALRADMFTASYHASV